MRLRLSDHKVELGQLGLKQTNQLKLYVPKKLSWINLLWDAPILIKHTGQALMVCCADIEFVEGWDTLLLYLTQAFTMNIKGKQREI